MHNDSAAATDSQLSRPPLASIPVPNHGASSSQGEPLKPRRVSEPRPHEPPPPMRDPRDPWLQSRVNDLSVDLLPLHGGTRPMLRNDISSTMGEVRAQQLGDGVPIPVPTFMSALQAAQANTLDFDLAQRLARLEAEVRNFAAHLDLSDVRLDTGGQKLDVLSAIIDRQAAQAAKQGAQLAEVLESQERQHEEVAELKRLFKSIVALCTSTSEKLEDTRSEVRRLKAQHAEEAAARARLETRLATEVAGRAALEEKLKITQAEVARMARLAGEPVSEEFGGHDSDSSPEPVNRRFSWIEAADKDIAKRRRSLQSPQSTAEKDAQRRRSLQTPRPVTPPETPRVAEMPTITELAPRTPEPAPQTPVTPSAVKV